MQHSPKQVRLVFTRLLVFNQRNGSLFQHYRKNWQHWPLWGKMQYSETHIHAVLRSLFT